MDDGRAVERGRAGLMSGHWQRFDYRLRRRTADRAMLGLLVLSTDATIEPEWRMLFTDVPGVEFHVARVACDSEINTTSLTAMEGRLDGAMADLLPDIHLDTVAYACTSASLLIGEQVVATVLRASKPKVPVTTPLTAAKAAFRALNAGRIALLTPYVGEINDRLHVHFQQAGFPVTAMGGFFNSSDPEVVRIDPQSILAASRRLTHKADVDLLFIACTALRASALVPRLERELSMAVTTSNHAMAWHALRLAGVGDRVSDRGSLFDCALPVDDHGVSPD